MTLPLSENKKSRFFYGYVIVAAAFVMMMMAWGVNFSFGLFLEALLKDIRWTRAVTSAAFSVSSLLYGLVSIISGRLTDRFGPRIVTSICCILLGMGYILMSLTTSVWQLFLFFGIIVGVSLSGFWAPLVSPVARWFTVRRGLMVGIITSGIGVGSVVIVPLVSRIIANYGWQTSYIIVGVTIMVITLLAAQFLRRDPQQMGLQPYGKDQPDRQRVVHRTEDLSFSAGIRLRQFWMAFGIYAGYGFYLYAVMVHIVLHATGLGISTVDAANILAISGGLGILGRVMIGSVSDRLGIKTSAALSITLMAIGLIWLLFCNELWMFYVFAVVFGVGYGSLSALQGPMAVELFGLRSVGIFVGCLTFSFTIGGALGPFLAGYIFDAMNSYTLAFFICVIISIAGLILALLLSPVRKEAEDETGRSIRIG